MLPPLAACVILTTKKYVTSLILFLCVFGTASVFMLRPQHDLIFFLCAYPLTHTKKTCITYSHLCTFLCVFIMCTINTSKWIWYFFLLVAAVTFAVFCICIHDQTHTQWLMLSSFFLPILSFPSLQSSEWKKRLNITKVQLQPSSTYYLDDCHPKS